VKKDDEAVARLQGSTQCPVCLRTKVKLHTGPKNTLLIAIHAPAPYLRSVCLGSGKEVGKK